ncbi:MAG: hypothetical protein U0414_16860 [Polyangiaceae bacterium]
MRRAAGVGVALGVVALLVLAAIGARAGVAPDVLPKLSGSAAWLTSRAAGVTAFLALSLDVAFGLFVSTGVADGAIRRARSVEAHRFLSAAALGATALHVVALLTDGFVRFDALDVLVPFLSSYRPVAVGLGVVAAYTMVLVHASFGWRASIGAKVWRALHATSFVAYVGALLHGVFAGSDAHALTGLYAASGAVIGALVLYRIACAARRRAPAGR